MARALRRQSYELSAEGRFDVEYADMLGIPLDFAAEPVVVSPTRLRRTVRVHAVRPERDALTIEFPRVEGYSLERPVRAVLDLYSPRGSTAGVDFNTCKTNRWRTDPAKCHINWAICDSDWEAEFCRVVEAHPRVLAYVKNQSMGFSVPYRMGGTMHQYIPDFVLKIDDGGEEPVHLVAEVEGMVGEDAKVKARTMRASWVPGVNNLGGFGRWAFAEFKDVNTMEDDLTRWFAECASSPAVRAAHGLILAGGSQPDMEYVPRRRSAIDG